MAKKNEAKIKFTAETGEFNDRIKQADSSLSEMRSELKLNASQMKKTGDNTATLQKRQELLKKELETSKDKTQALTDKLEKAKEIFGENSEEAKKLQTQLNNAKTAEQKIAKEIQDTNAQLKKQKTALDEVADKADKTADKLTNAGKKMSLVSAGIGAVGAASVAAFNEVDEGADNAIKATGATGAAAEALEESYSNVAGQIVGDFGDIGAALGEVNTRFGFTGGKLESATLQFSKFSEITGMGAKDAVQAVSRALNDAGIPLDQYDSLLDQLAKAGQAAGIDVATLADSLSQNGAVMRGMGFDTEETIALLSQFELSGADTSTMLTGMKKAMANWAKEGKNGNKEFAKTVEGVKNGSITASDALDIFGTRAGPMLVDAIKSGKFEYNDMLTTIQSSKGTVESTFDGTVDGGYKMELAMQNAKVALAEVGDTVATSLTPLVESATSALKGFANWWSGLNSSTQTTILTIVAVVAAIGPLLLLLGSVAGAISKIATAMKLAKTAITVVKTAMAGLNLTFLASPITWIVLGIAALVAAFVALWNNCEGFRQFWIDLWEGIKNACGAAWEAIKGFFTGAWEAIKTAWSGVKNFFSGIWDGIKNVFSNVGSWFSEKFTQAKNNAQNAWSNVKSFFSGIWSGIKNAFSNVGSWFSEKFTQGKEAAVNAWSNVKSGFSNAWSSIKSTFSNVGSWFKEKFSSARDGITSVWNKLKLNMPKIKLPHFKITGEWSWNPLSVPKLSVDWYAKGGIFTKPTIFPTASGFKGVGDVRGGEAVLPINLLQGYISNALDRSMPTQDLTPLVRAIEQLADRPIDLNVDGRRFAQATAGAADSVNGYRNRMIERGLVLE